MVKPNPQLNLESKFAWHKGRRRIASVIIALHLLAIFSAPWSFPPPSSELARRVAGVLEPYQVATYINHGYRFFAPDPGASHLVRYEIEQADGTAIEGSFPNRKIWPRLLYHRHFMISESVFNVENSLNNLETALKDSAQPDLITDDERELIDQTRQLSTQLRKGIARQLLQEHGGERVRLFLVEHQIPRVVDFLNGMPLDDKRLYVELTPMGEYEQSQL